MQLIEIMEPDFFFPDDRGTLAQLVHGGYSQINAVFTKKGAVRGNWHYHKRTKEAFYVLAGEIEVSVRRGDAAETRVFRSGDMFMIHENVRHTFAYLEDTYLVALYTTPVERADGTKDIYNDETAAAGGGRTPNDGRIQPVDCDLRGG